MRSSIKKCPWCQAEKSHTQKATQRPTLDSCYHNPLSPIKICVISLRNCPSSITFTDAQTLLPKQRCSARFSRFSSKRLLLSSPVRRRIKEEICVAKEKRQFMFIDWGGRPAHVKPKLGKKDSTYPIFWRPVLQKDGKLVTSD